MSNNKPESKQEDLPQKEDSLRKVSCNRKTKSQIGNQTSHRNTGSDKGDLLTKLSPNRHTKTQRDNQKPNINTCPRKETH